MRLVTAEAGVLTEILDGTYPIWGEGLSRDAYEKWNRAQMETIWGRANLRRVALTDGGRVLSSAKRYDLEALSGGRRARVLGIGAVFTDPSLRGQGHAAALVEAMIADAAARGCELALLFSEIGAAYYERLGFHVIAQRVPTIEVVRKPGAPAQLVRAGEPTDFDAIAEMAARARHGAAFALDRSAHFIAFMLARKRLLAGLGPAGLRSVEFFVTEEAYRAVAYVVISRGPHGVFLEDCGDCDPTGARIGAMLQVLDAREPAEPPLRCRASIPPGLAPSQWRVLGDAPADEIMMARLLGEDRAIMPSQTVYPHLDVF
ncbi:MAG TPA: GNAT family N-acetyltransferase [Vicinamibacterales bacterium]|nr:GNAT family N-acetyltransferase [Vicinamibacterales bacterium]